jgi:outer membrane immunogenic protein
MDLLSGGSRSITSQEKSMKKLMIIAAAVTTLAAPQAFAQAKNFEGFSVAAAVNVNNNKGEAISAVDRTESNVGASAQYDMALGEAFVLGVGVSVGLSDFNIASDAKLKNTYGVFVAPGFAVSKDTLVYGKIASVSAKADFGSTSVDLSGVGYGIGARYLSGKNVYFQAEYMYNKYDDKKVNSVTFKNQTGVLSMGVGYKF